MTTPYVLNIDPVAFSIGSLNIHWYGLSYVFAFVVGWSLMRMAAKRPFSVLKADDVDDLVTWIILGVILGARLGYVIFYDLINYLSDPIQIIQIWRGGLSFHGGLLGVVIVVFWWARRHKHSFLSVLDAVSPAVPPGIFFVRIANFINGELWGSITTSSFGVIFPSGGPFPRHPSQLYEALLEGLLLTIIMQIYARKERTPGHVAGVMAIGYAVCRFSVEFVRMPDAHLGYLAFGWLTMGQILSLPLFLAGLWFITRPKK